MKAVQISQYGDAGVLTVTADAPKPAVGEGKVLVEVRAASINPVDTMVRLGYLAKMAPLAFPATLGTDVAGVVVEVGSGVADLKKGDKVFGMASVLAGASGAFAQYVTVPAGMLARIPAGLGFNEAAALPLTGVSALEVIDEKLKVGKGHKILIHGGSGGIGTIAIQLAKHRGAFVATTVMPEGVEYARNLGADKVIDVQKEAFEKVLSGYDFVFDAVAGETYKKSFAVLKRGGTIISMLEQPDADLAAKHGVTALAQNTQVTTARLNALSGLVSNGAIKVHVDRVFPVDKVKEAFLAREGGKVRGKVVLSF
ncbi:MAG: NADP-dependent oxidoreductase [Spirochaetia bacterium]|jgi:NADPH:quinone reductase-like Zn-dependent oxidoreductase